MDMMGILAQSLMIAARAEPRVLMRDAEKPGEKPYPGRSFRHGRRWRPVDPDKI